MTGLTSYRFGHMSRLLQWQSDSPMTSPSTIPCMVHAGDDGLPLRLARHESERKPNGRTRSSSVNGAIVISPITRTIGYCPTSCKNEWTSSGSIPCSDFSPETLTCTKQSTGCLARLYPISSGQGTKSVRQAETIH